VEGKAVILQIYSGIEITPAVLTAKLYSAIKIFYGSDSPIALFAALTREQIHIALDTGIKTEKAYQF
jgi:hypothetical protein